MSLCHLMSNWFKSGNLETETFSSFVLNIHSNSNSSASMSSAESCPESRERRGGKENTEEDNTKPRQGCHERREERTWLTKHEKRAERGAGVGVASCS